MYWLVSKLVNKTRRSNKTGTGVCRSLLSLKVLICYESTWLKIVRNYRKTARLCPTVYLLVLDLKNIHHAKVIFLLCKQCLVKEN